MLLQQTPATRWQQAKLNELPPPCAQDIGVAWGSIFANVMVCFSIGAVIVYVL